MALWIGLLSALVAFTVGSSWFKELSAGSRFGLLFIWLFAVMLWLSFGVVRHADALAILLGEPRGAIILTLSVISIEVVMISAVMLTGPENPTLARDTIFSVLMIVLTGMIGISLLVGGLKHKELAYNLEGARTYLGVLIPLAGVTLIMPRYMTGAPGGAVTVPVGAWLVVASAGLWVAFLWIQAQRHAGYFVQPSADKKGAVMGDDLHGDVLVRSLGHHILFLPLTMLPIVLLSKNMGELIDYGLGSFGAPAALGGFLVAILVLTPEAVSAVKAALANQLQRSLNIGMGSALSTIGMTVPAVLIISWFTGKRIELGLDQASLFLLLIVLIAALANFGGRRTNVMQGIVHLVLFLTYVVLIFD